MPGIGGRFETWVKAAWHANALSSGAHVLPVRLGELSSINDALAREVLGEAPRLWVRERPMRLG